MPESDEKRELGGLAQSIDALFSQRPQAPATREPEADSVDVSLEEPAGSEPARPGTSTPDDVGAASPPETAVPEPDPFESIESVDAVVDPGDSSDLDVAHAAPELEAARSEGDPFLDSIALSEEEPTEDAAPEEETAEAEPQETGLALDTGLEEALPAVQSEEQVPEVETAEGEALEAGAPAEEAEPELPASALSEAVDAFLAGHPGAGEDVESAAAAMRERLALDPLADAVERLVFAAEGAPDDPAVEMAARVVHPAVASRLVQRMAMEEDEGRRADYITLAERLGTVMANAFKGALTEATDSRTRRVCYDGLIAMGDEARPVIDAMVEDDNSFLVQNGVSILGELGDEGAVQLVTSALANPDFRVRREALMSLAKLGGEDSGQLIMASLEDPDATVRAAAAEAAGTLRLERALRPILALLEDTGLSGDEKAAVQVQALKGLGALGDPGAVQAIEKRAVGSRFRKPPTEVRVAAYEALRAIGTPHARELIEKAKDDKDPVVRTTVRGFDSE